MTTPSPPSSPIARAGRSLRVWHFIGIAVMYVAIVQAEDATQAGVSA